jgi:3-deoxy-D-manno-octulosonic-acid transferase
MIRLLYTVIFYGLFPAIVVRLLLRSVQSPQYLQRFSERLGFFPLAEKNIGASIWIHTVSVGETIAAKPLIEALLQIYPQHSLVITTMTPTGSAQVHALFSQHIAQGRVQHSYIPYDLPDCVNRFLRRVKPQIAIFMETEVWPNILFACHQRDIATVLINARLSDKSLRAYQKVISLSRATFSTFTHVSAQTQSDASRLQLLGANPVSVSGNIKLEITVSHDLRQQAEQLKQDWSLLGEKKIIVAASTHRGEDEIILAAYQHLLDQQENVLLLIVPRHPERFEAVRQLCVNQGLATILRSKNTAVEASTQVMVGDTMGEMMLLYGVADIAIVCGSFITHGGHNMLEPAAWGLPIISGNSVYNFAKVSEDMVSQNALALVSDKQQLVEKLQQLLADTSLALSMGENAKKYIESNVGALSKTMLVLKKYLSH